MKTKVEGIIITKVPYRDRDLICKLLLRSGKRISVLFYGGRGGGSKKKSSVLELGHMLALELKRSNSNSDMQIAKEWNPIWVHNKLRNDHRAFYLMCLFLEVILKISLEENLHDDNAGFDQESEGIFRVLSNGIYHIEASLKKGDFKSHQHLGAFIGKNMLEQGIFPAVGGCSVCGGQLIAEQGPVLSADLGGFSCYSCYSIENKLPANIPTGEIGPLFRFFEVIPALKYKNYAELCFLDGQTLKQILNYFCYQFHFKESDFKSLPFVF
ncbi:MAG: recombination protein O N-terminal domain-containing protein [Bacteriovoracaceae bacterium]|nr:recombination protein O N-terminal domain-containing protein [Bacteriovoracaceae bacterium]